MCLPLLRVVKWFSSLRRGLFEPAFGHVAPDRKALPLAKFAVELFDLFVLTGSTVVVSFEELCPEP